MVLVSCLALISLSILTPLLVTLGENNNSWSLGFLFMWDQNCKMHSRLCHHCVWTYQMRSCSSLNISLKPLVQLFWLGQAYIRWFYLPTVFRKNWVNSPGPNSYFHKGHITCQEDQSYLPDFKKQWLDFFR